MSNGFKVGVFNKSTGAAPVDQSVTGVGFTPKALILICTAATAEGSQSDLALAIGLTAGATQSESLTAWSDDNVSTSSTWQAKLARALTITAITSGVAAQCDLKSFDSDGFTLRWLTNDANAYKIQYIAFGGSDITNAAVKFMTHQTGTGNKSFTGVGFQPDIIFLLSDNFSTPGHFGNSGLSIGLGAGMSATKRWATCISADTGATMANALNAQTYQRTDSIYLSVNPSGSQEHRFDLVSMDSDGFTLNQIANVSDVDFGVLCIKGGSWDLGSFAKTTGAAPVDQSVTGLSFAPDGFILASGKDVAASTSIVANAVNSMGAASGPTERAATNVFMSDTSIPTAARSGIWTNRCFAGQDPNSAVNIADIKSLNSDGFTVTWTTNDTGNNPGILWVAAKLAGPGESFPAGHLRTTPTPLLRM